MIRKLTILFLFIVFPRAWAEPPTSTPVRTAEKTIRIGYPAFDWAPFTFVSQKGHVSGLLPSLVHEIIQESGHQTETTIYPTFSDVLTAFHNNDIDLLVGVSSTYNRQQTMLFSKPLITIPMAAITDTKNLHSIHQLGSKVIAVEEGFAIEEQIRQLVGNNPIVTPTATSEDAFTTVMAGKADAYIGNAITLDNMQRYHKSDKRFSLSLLEDIPYERLYIAARKDQPELITMLNQRLEQVSQQQLEGIYDTWLSNKQKQLISHQHLLHLNPAEAQWVESRSSLKVAYHPNDFPYQFTDQNGLMGGISADVLHILAKQLNITLVPIANSNFNDILEHLNTGTIDAVAAVTCTPERLRYFSCSQPYSEEKWVMVTAVENKREYIRHSAKIAVVAQKFGEILTRQQYSDNPIIIYNDNEPLLNAVIGGEADYAVISLSSASRLLQGNYLGKLRIIASELDNNSLPVGFAIAKDNTLVTSIFNKTLANISPSELTDIQHKWQTVTLNSGISANRLALWAISLIGVICAIVTSFAYWNRKLTNEVQQRKAIEEKLTYLTNNVDGILMQHTQHSQDPEDISVQFISENIHQFTGFSADEFKENPQRLIELLRQRSDHKRLFSEFYRAVEHGYWQTELQLQSPAGQQRWLEIRSQVVQIDNGWQWTSILIDITIMKQQQLELERARREAETAAQAKSRFLAMMSHEIRTPISGILSMLELLEPHIRHDLHARGLHNHLDLSAKNLLNIVNDVLDFSKIEAGKLTLSPAPCSIADLVAELIQPHAIYAQQKGLGFRLWLAPNIADQLHCDPLRLRQVLNNLLNNAAKFTEQGEIAVSVNVIEETPQQQTLQISVSDSGIGISEDDLGKLFQPFEQADASSERRFSGTGLGLSICRQLVHLMGGDITAFSTLGEGSIFRFSLPAKRIALQQQLSMDLRCGLFDIEKDNTSLLVQYLSYWHCDVVELNDDSPSWATISDGQYDVVLMPQRWQAKVEAIETKLKLPPKVIYLADSPLLSAEPCHQGWVIGNFPLVPQQLLQALANVPSAPCLQPSSLQQPSLQQLGTMPMASTCIDRETAMAQKRLLLVAEDHPINQQIIRQQLQALGFYADIVSNGLEALEALHSQQYALLISDCHMPELDGYGLVKAIRQQQTTPLARNTQHFYLPVIALTANTAADAKAHIEHYQFDDFLTKPVSLDTLSEKLSDWLALSPHHSDSDTEQTAFTVGIQQDNPEIKRHPGPINIDTITTMFGDLETCTHFIKQYMNSCVNDLDALSTAIHSQNSDTIRLISHRMKGAARMMEYQEMAEQCELIEKQSICSKVNMISIEPIHAMLDDLRRQVRQLS